MRPCPNCGHANPENAGFCIECGHELAAGRTCPTCGYGGNPPEAGYCIQCGAPLRRRSLTPFIWAGGVAAILLLAVILWQVGAFEALMARVPFPVTAGIPGSGPTKPAGEEAMDGTRPPTDAPTAAPTAVPSATRSADTPSAEPTPTATPPAASPTTAPTATATRPTKCPGAPPQRVHVSGRARVCTAYDQLIVRQRPGLGHQEVTRLEPNTYVTVVDGPVCADEWSWWRIRTDDGMEGWVSEGGDEVDPYFICPAE